MFEKHALGDKYKCDQPSYTNTCVAIFSQIVEQIKLLTKLPLYMSQKCKREFCTTTTYLWVSVWVYNNISRLSCLREAYIDEKVAKPGVLKSSNILGTERWIEICEGESSREFVGLISETMRREFFEKRVVNSVMLWKVWQGLTSTGLGSGTIVNLMRAISVI